MAGGDGDGDGDGRRAVEAWKFAVPAAPPVQERSIVATRQEALILVRLSVTSRGAFLVHPNEGRLMFDIGLKMQVNEFVLTDTASPRIVMTRYMCLVHQSGIFDASQTHCQIVECC